MGKVQKIIIAAFIIAAFVYIFVRTVVFVGDGVLAFVTDANGQIFGYLHKRVNVVPQGIFTTIKVHYIPLNGSCNVDIVIPVPPLESIKSDHYSIKIPVVINYTLNPEQLTLDLNRLYLDTLYLSQQFGIRLAGSIKDAISRFLYPYYQYNALQANIQKEVAVAIDHVKESFARDGIIIKEVTPGVIYVPDYTVYTEGKRFLLELLTQEKFSTIQLNALQQQLKEDELKNARYLEHLEKISRIIAKNKDILKYIYIDKLADNVRVIVTSDKNIPLDMSNDIESESLKKDFDNFKK
ncbi:MAG: hypothetical protein AB1444_14055 [Spirochaetota bacterium]